MSKLYVKMKTVKRIIIFAFAVAALWSCGTTRYVSDITAAQAVPMVLIHPYSQLEYVQSNGDVTNDAPSSRDAEKLLAQCVRIQFPEVSSVIDTDDVTNPEDILNPLSALPFVNVKKLDSSAVPVAIRNLILDNGGRFGVLVYSEGFTRDIKNYRRSVAKDVLLAVVTTVVSFGAVTMIGSSSKYGSHVYLMVVDAVENRIVYYDKSIPEDANPLSQKTVNRQIAAIRKHFK